MRENVDQNNSEYGHFLRIGSFRRSHNKRQVVSVADDMNLSVTKFNNDLNKVNASANQWKLIFNPDPYKQAQEAIFLVK